MTFKFNCAALLAATVACALCATARADDWGSLKGRFLYDGAAPAPAPIDVDKDKEICGNKNLVNEDLVVGAGGELANVMIYLRTKDAAVHPDYAKTADGKVVLDNKGCRFEPHVQGIRVGQTLLIKNSDPMGHNTNVQGGEDSNKFNQIIPSGGSFEQKISDPENIPALVACNIHGWMKGRLMIRPDPYFAASSKDGTFEIKNLPAGDLEFQLYHERVGYVQQGNTGGADVKWPKGHLKVTIKPGETTDLGDIKLSADQFNK